MEMNSNDEKLVDKLPTYPDAKHPNSYGVGMEFEDFCREQCQGIGLILSRFSSRKRQFERGDGLIDEIKLDNRFTETKRLSIEISEKSRADNPYFIPSGIYAKSSFWLYIQGNYDLIFIFSRKTLKNLHNSNRYEEHQKPTITSYYLPLADAFEYCETFVAVSETGKRLVEDYNRKVEEEESDF